MKSLNFDATLKTLTISYGMDAKERTPMKCKEIARNWDYKKRKQNKNK